MSVTRIERDPAGPADWAQDPLRFYNWALHAGIKVFANATLSEPDYKFAHNHVQVSEYMDVRALPIDFKKIKPINNVEAWFMTHLHKDELVMDLCTSDEAHHIYSSMSNFFSTLASAFEDIIRRGSDSDPSSRTRPVESLMRVVFQQAMLRTQSTWGEKDKFRITTHRAFPVLLPGKTFIPVSNIIGADTVVTVRIPYDESVCTNYFAGNDLASLTFFAGHDAFLKNQNRFEIDVVLFAKESDVTENAMNDFVAKNRLVYVLSRSVTVLHKWGVVDAPVYGFTQVGFKVQFYVCTMLAPKVHDKQPEILFGPVGIELNLEHLRDFFTFYITLCKLRDTELEPLSVKVKAQDLKNVLSARARANLSLTTISRSVLATDAYEVEEHPRTRSKKRTHAEARRATRTDDQFAD